MEEKKYFKISLGTAILIAIIVILIIALLGIYFYYNPKKEEENDADKNTTSTNIENTPNINSSNSLSNEYHENNNIEKDVLSSTEVDKIAKELFENGSEIIRELKYTDDLVGYDESSPREEKSINGKRYLKTIELYENVEKEYSKLFTETALNNVLNERFANIDGILYVSIGGASGWNITNLEVTRTSEKNDEIEYIAKYNNVDLGGTSNEQQSCKMTIKLVDETYKISAINYCDIDKND